MCVLLITRLLRGVGRWARKPVNHTSWVAVVTPADRPRSVHNCCLIELFCGVVCVVTLPFWPFCWCRGFCHRTGFRSPPFCLEICSMTSKIKRVHPLVIVNMSVKFDDEAHNRSVSIVSRGHMWQTDAYTDGRMEPQQRFYIHNALRWNS